MEMVITWAAEPDERFAPGSLTGLLGNQVPVKVGDHQRDGKVTAVEVSPDGKEAKVTVYVDDSRIAPVMNARLAGEPPAMSFGWAR